MVCALTFLNAQIGPDTLASMRVAGAKIDAIGELPRPGDLVVDLRGARVFPGLINAHDHLHLNTLPPIRSLTHWRHAREWADEVTLHRHKDAKFAAHLAVTLNERLLIGGLKNLLSGVTTVAHHDLLYPFLAGRGFPVGVVANYGWSHSLYVDGEERVRNAYQQTPPDWPWIIHLAEGVDEEAAGEFARLEQLGCLGANTLLVHGIALDAAARSRLAAASAGLIWCPSSNRALFGRTAEVASLALGGRVALGTDSRFTGSRDLLCELATARESSTLEESTLEGLVTRDAASLLRLNDRGVLRVGARADMLVLPEGMALSRASRADVRLVVAGGRALYADPDCAALVSPPTHWAPVQVDGRPKMLERQLAAAVSLAAVHEPGLDIRSRAWAAA